jgi:hypothetical protein
MSFCSRHKSARKCSSGCVGTGGQRHGVEMAPELLTKSGARYPTYM